MLSTQLDKASAIRSFARDLALVSDTLAASDGDLRRVIANGGATATQLRPFLEENKVDLAKLINNLVTTGEVQVRHLDGHRDGADPLPLRRGRRVRRQRPVARRELTTPTSG